MAQNNAVPEACDCAKKWVSIGLKSEVSVFGMAGLVFAEVYLPMPLIGHLIIACLLKP